MDTLKFKTNIKCAACVAKVTSTLNEVVGVDNWEVDIANPEKILTIVGHPDEIKLKGELTKVGYKAERF